MKLPSFLYGLYHDVKPRCRKLVTRVRRGTPWSELAEDYVDTEEVPGLFILNGPIPYMGDQPHFHLFAPLTIAEDAMPERLGWEYEQILFEESLKTVWGALGLASDGGKMFYCLGHAGIPVEKLRAPLPPGGLKELVAEIPGGLPEN
jgi:hypothetical protein